MENRIGECLIGAATEVHRYLGPGLLESAYEACLLHELELRGLRTARQISMPVRYKSLKVTDAFRMDLLVENKVVVELKAVEATRDIHKAQLLSYLRMGDFRLGYLMNFNVTRMRDGIFRVVNRLAE